MIYTKSVEGIWINTLKVEKPQFDETWKTSIIAEIEATDANGQVVNVSEIPNTFELVMETNHYPSLIETLAYLQQEFAPALANIKNAYAGFQYNIVEIPTTIKFYEAKE